MIALRSDQRQYADSRTAYDDLSEDMKKKLDGLVANHSLFHSRKTAVPEFFKDTDPAKLPLSKHLLVQKHEATGRMVNITAELISNRTNSSLEPLHCFLCTPHTGHA